MANRSWVSAHIYFDGDLYSSQCDRVITSVVEPIVLAGDKGGWLSKFFFIRYHDDGSHVRFRLSGRPEGWAQRLQERVDRHVDAVSREWMSGSHDGSPPCVRWRLYEPEMVRYGGSLGLRLAEDHFDASSRASFRVIRNLRTQDRSKRLAAALLFMLVMAYRFFPSWDKLSSAFDAYGTISRTALGGEIAGDMLDEWDRSIQDRYQSQSSSINAYVWETLRRLENGAALTPVLDSYRSTCQDLHGRITRLQKEGKLSNKGRPFESVTAAAEVLVPSYIHMMNNRIGISVDEELYLSRCLCEAISSAMDKSPMRKV